MGQNNLRQIRQHFGRKCLAPKWVKRYKADPANDESSRALYACLPTKQTTTKDPVNPKENSVSCPQTVPQITSSKFQGATGVGSTRHRKSALTLVLFPQDIACEDIQGFITFIASLVIHFSKSNIKLASSIYHNHTIK